MRVYKQRPDHNTGNYVPYSLRTVSGFFNVPQLFNKDCETGLRFIVLIRDKEKLFDLEEIETKTPNLINAASPTDLGGQTGTSRGLLWRELWQYESEGYNEWCAAITKDTNDG